MWLIRNPKIGVITIDQQDQNNYNNSYYLIFSFCLNDNYRRNYVPKNKTNDPGNNSKNEIVNSKYKKNQRVKPKRIYQQSWHNVTEIEIE